MIVLEYNLIEIALQSVVFITHKSLKYVSNYNYSISTYLLSGKL